MALYIALAIVYSDAQCNRKVTHGSAEKVRINQPKLINITIVKRWHGSMHFYILSLATTFLTSLFRRTVISIARMLHTMAPQSETNANKQIVSNCPRAKAQMYPHELLHCGVMFLFRLAHEAAVYRSCETIHRFDGVNVYIIMVMPTAWNNIRFYSLSLSLFSF